MTTISPAAAGPLRIPIETLVAQHGAWRVLAAATLALMRRRRQPLLGIDRLNEHLLRDIGLASTGSAPRRDL